MKTRFIVNARSGAAASTVPAVRVFAEKHDAEVVFTERPRHASELAARAIDAGCELVVAVGGDGTMNEVAAVLTGTSATFGLIPCGSGDGLGRHLGLHGPASRALELLRTGQPRLIDTGLADGHPFFAVAGLGFEAEIARRFNRLQRRGFLRYLSTSAAALREWKPVELTVTHGPQKETVRAFTLAVANTGQYGNNAHIAPAAQVDDGLLDLTAIPSITVLNALPLIIRLFAGSLAGSPRVITRRSDRFLVERAAAGPMHTDGEIHQAGTSVEFSIRPASLRIVVPSAK